MQMKNVGNILNREIKIVHRNSNFFVKKLTKFTTTTYFFFFRCVKLLEFSKKLASITVTIHFSHAVCKNLVSKFFYI